MTKESAIKIFENRQVRTVWDSEQEEWYFSVVDVVAVLTDSVNPTDYLKKLRKRDVSLGEYLGTNCPQVEMVTETGKKRKTLAANIKDLFRIIQSIPSPEIRKDLTDEWKRLGVQEGLKKENLRDNMTNTELVLNMLAELSTKQISETSNPESFIEHAQVAVKGGEIARNARRELEQKTGKSTISSLNAKTEIMLGKHNNNELYE